MQTKLQISTNAEQRLFVISTGEGYSCFGFDNCYRHALQLSQLLGRPDLAPKENEIGELKQYELYQKLVRLAGDADIGTYFDPGTPTQVREILERYRLNGSPLRLFFGDDVTGRDWLEEHDVYGYIRRSMGPLKVPLLTGRLSGGGSAILTANVVRILDGRTLTELYRHPTYHQASFTIESCSMVKYKAQVLADGELHARFPTLVSAQRWVAFMKGETIRL